MSAMAFLQSLRSRGIAVRTDGVKIAAKPSTALTYSDHQSIAHHKGDIIAILQGVPSPLVLHSRLLGEVVHVVEEAFEGLPPPPAGSPVTYTRRDLELLEGSEPEKIRAAHILKRNFGGFCMEVNQ